MGRLASVANLLSQSTRFLLTPEEAARIVETMETAVRARWYEVVRREGVSERDCDAISPSFVYDGFRGGDNAA
jgi:serine/threonine-protein kinase HipA